MNTKICLQILQLIQDITTDDQTLTPEQCVVIVRTKGTDIPFGLLPTAELLGETTIDDITHIVVYRHSDIREKSIFWATPNDYVCVIEYKNKYYLRVPSYLSLQTVQVDFARVHAFVRELVIQYLQKHGGLCEIMPYNYAELEKLAEETRYFNVTFELTRGLIELCACEWERIYVAGPAQWVLLVSGYVSQQYAPLLNEAPWFGRKDRLLGLLRAITGHSRALPDLMSYMVWISRTMPGTLGFWQEYIKTEKETEMEKP